MVLSPEDTLLALSSHLARQEDHLLKALCDITELVKKYNEVLDWDYILASARSWGIEITVYYCLRRSKELLGAPVPVNVIEALKPVTWRRWALELLLSKEAFVAPARWSKLRNETLVLFNSLMMRYPRQMVEVLFRYRGREKRAAWLRMVVWTIVAFGAGLGRNMSKLLPWGKPQVSCSGNNVIS
jgi:hypothetical protein